MRGLLKLSLTVTPKAGFEPGSLSHKPWRLSIVPPTQALLGLSCLPLFGLELWIVLHDTKNGQILSCEQLDFGKVIQEKWATQPRSKKVKLFQGTWPQLQQKIKNWWRWTSSSSCGELGFERRTSTTSNDVRLPMNGNLSYETVSFYS